MKRPIVNRQFSDAELFDPALSNYEPPDRKRANGYRTNSGSADGEPNNC
jgi:hypothetical protein